MKLQKEMISLISDIEYKIGNSCYNGDSYNGWTEEYGCSFRYPIVYETKEEGKVYTWKTRGKIEWTDRIDDSNIKTVCYRFGANELCIGAAIVDVLEMLEERYGIDFNELEKKYEKENNNIRPPALPGKSDMGAAERVGEPYTIRVEQGEAARGLCAV